LQRKFPEIKQRICNFKLSTLSLLKYVIYAKIDFDDDEDERELLVC